jgi:putative transposase
VNRAAKRSQLFHAESDYAAFERILVRALERFPIALFAYCLMPNHWHFLLSPGTDDGLSRFMHWLTTTHARRWQHAHDQIGEGAVYQGRFKAIPIGGTRHFHWVCRYVERNALRARLVNRAEDWKWSSLSRRMDEAPRWLAAWPCEYPRDWVEAVNTPQTDAELLAFRTASSLGRPFGDR